MTEISKICALFATGGYKNRHPPPARGPFSPNIASSKGPTRADQPAEPPTDHVAPASTPDCQTRPTERGEQADSRTIDAAP
jgi:hypothetical protein